MIFGIPATVLNGLVIPISRFAATLTKCVLLAINYENTLYMYLCLHETWIGMNVGPYF